MATFTIDPAPRSTALLVSPVAGVVIPVAALGATVALDLPIASERASTGWHVDFGVEVQDAGPSTNWKPYVLAGWNSGSGITGKNSTVLNPPPSVNISGDFFQAFAGRRARLRYQASVTGMTAGATVTVL
jgi:hypothetical protein